MHRLEGQRFGKLVVRSYFGDGKWACDCDCGNKSTALTYNLRSGNTQSCGCRQLEVTTKHGMSRTHVYGVWKSMIQRCENPNDAAFGNYGARGISVCDDWHEFAKFIADVGIRPRGFQLDRRDNGLGYSKENCEWVTAKVNRNNTRQNRLVTFNGVTRTIAQWADERGMKYRTLNNRINRGWPVERALTEPVQE